VKSDKLHIKSWTWFFNDDVRFFSYEFQTKIVLNIDSIVFRSVGYNSITFIFKYNFYSLPNSFRISVA